MWLLLTFVFYNNHISQIKQSSRNRIFSTACDESKASRDSLRFNPADPYRIIESWRSKKGITNPPAITGDLQTSFSNVIETLKMKRSTPLDTIQEVWKRHYAHEANYIFNSPNECAYAITVDTVGNVYVLGNDGLKKYDESGNEIWTKEVSGNKLVMDHSDNIVVAGDILVKYDVQGNVLWSDTLKESISDIEIDTLGNIVILLSMVQDDTCYEECIMYDVDGECIGWMTVCVSRYYYHTIKYDAYGTVSWDRVFGSDITDDYRYPYAIKIDQYNGDIYITGNPETIKYDHDGNLIWVKNISGNVLDIDQNRNLFIGDYNRVEKYDTNGIPLWCDSVKGEKGICVDDEGNLYTSGSWGTKKYNSYGQIIWVNNIGGKNLLIDNSGFLFVADTYRDAPNCHSNYQTAKYDTEGNLQWVAIYDGPAHLDDDLSDLAFDKLGNVLVTGSSIGNDGSKDYLTIKYSTSGLELWTKRYGKDPERRTVIANYAAAMDIDKQGDIVVAGSSHGDLEYYDYDYATIKYTPQGEELWLNRFSYEKSTYYSKSYNTVNDMVIDSFGNIIVTGSSGTIKYNSSGEFQWRNEVDGDYISVDTEGNIFLTGICVVGEFCDSVGNICVRNRDIITIKLNSNGIEQWRRIYGAPGRSEWDTPSAIATDATGNVYIAGSTGEFPNYNYTIIKYSPNGQELWIAYYDGPSNSEDYTRDIHVDELGNIIVAGSSTNELGYFDFTTVKYNSIGEQLWVARYSLWPDTSTQRTDIVVMDMEVDKSGNTYVTGMAVIGSFTACVFIILKYNPSGELLWQSFYTAYDTLSNFLLDVPRVIQIDTSGNVYVSGECYIYSHDDIDFVTLKLNPEGKQQWVAISDGIGGIDYCVDMKIDGAGNIYLTGTSNNVNCNDVYTTIKYEQIPTTVTSNNLLPTDFTLYQNYPNPFNPSTTIKYELPKESFVTLKVYNVLGQEVATLVNEKQKAGKHNIEFKAMGLSSGVYFYQLTASGFVETKKLILLR